MFELPSTTGLWGGGTGAGSAISSANLSAKGFLSRGFSDTGLVTLALGAAGRWVGPSSGPGAGGEGYAGGGGWGGWGRRGGPGSS